jgi:hypothetical protein
MHKFSSVPREAREDGRVVGWCEGRDDKKKIPAPYGTGIVQPLMLPSEIFLSAKRPCFADTT